MGKTYDLMTYWVTRKTPAHGWVIVADDGTEVLTLPPDTPGPVVKAVAAAFTSEAERNA